VWFSCGDYEATEYAILKLKRYGSMYTTTVIPAKKAKELIIEHNMKEKLANEYGRVWELPRASFKRRFSGTFKYGYD
jgi:hypothetical protein